MPGRDFHFPLALLIRQAGRLKDALANATAGPPVIARLPATFVADFTTLLGNVSGAPATKAAQTGAVGTLTREQNAAFAELIRLMGAARRSGGLAFKGNRVVLREEFQVGVHEPHGLDHEVARAKIIQAATVKYATDLAAHGWTAPDATDLQNAIATLGSADLQQEAGKAEGPGLTAAGTANANNLYKNCLTIQNAARLQYPSTKPGNETARALFLIGEFPPHGQDDTGGTPTPPPAPPKPPGP